MNTQSTSANRNSSTDYSSARWILVALIAGIVIVFSFLFQRQLETGKYMPDFSIRSHGRDGLAQAADFLTKLGYRPTAVTRPIHQTRHQGLLFIVEPEKRFHPLTGWSYFSEADVKGLFHWVEKGNTLLLFSSKATSLHDELSVDLTPDANRKLDSAVAGLSGLTVNMKAVETEGAATVSASGGVPLWWGERGTGATMIRRGNGMIVVVADPTLLTHRGLLRSDNVLLLYNAARTFAHDGQVFFDEYHHGLRSGGGYWAYLRYQNQHWILIQLVIAASIVFWAVGKRLGPAVAPVAPAKADAVDFASATARIYKRAHAESLLGDWIVRDFMEKLRHRLRLPMSADVAAITDAWARRYLPDSAKRLQLLLRDVQWLRYLDSQMSHATETQLLDVIRAMDAFWNQSGK